MRKMSERGATELPVQVKSSNELMIRLIKKKKELYARFSAGNITTMVSVFRSYVLAKVRKHLKKLILV